MKLTHYRQKHKKLLELQLTQKQAQNRNNNTPNHLLNCFRLLRQHRTELRLLLSPCRSTAESAHPSNRPLRSSRPQGCSTSHTALVLDCSQMLEKNCPAWAPWAPLAWRHNAPVGSLAPPLQLLQPLLVHLVCLGNSSIHQRFVVATTTTPSSLALAKLVALVLVMSLHGVFHSLWNGNIHGLVLNPL